jgi:LCP family protein required for cell wall assembly
MVATPSVTAYSISVKAMTEPYSLRVPITPIHPDAARHAAFIPGVFTRSSPAVRGEIITMPLRRRGWGVRERKAPPGVAAVIGWTALSAILPGAAHLRAGWRRTGFTLLGLYAVIVLGVVVVVMAADVGLLARALDWLGTITIVALVAGAAWLALIVHSYVALRPGSLSAGAQVLSGVTAGVLSVGVAIPFALAADYANVSRQSLDEVFDAPPAAVTPVRPEDPWNGRTRVNILMLGGDWQQNRVGIRTDSINLASVDVRTGNTVLLGLPRNLENIRFPPGSPLRARFPGGFRLPANPDGSREDLLFAVWEYAETHPELFGGRKGMGPETLKGAVGYTLGLKVDWYALVNIWGFARIIDALGGLRVTVDTDVVFGKHNEGLVKAGTRTLRGADAMWFARSRTFSDDFTRMRRQRCVFSALLQQADPATVLSRFTQLTRAAKGMFRTDIPRPMLQHLVPLALKVKDAKVTSLQFVPPLINTGYPDWSKIRTLTAQAIRDSARAKAAKPAVTADPTPTRTGSVATPRAGATPGVPSAPRSIDDGCGI